ncbi:hypothetical protein Salat_0077600 [Sesamum alatum]|uniref:Uncharacterized protein n=1 Tax=Sesamum alatum TaxID=300844 RepID=A0AAE1YWK7_9LAMI|nr:hypothetical protein Salat_0077600 [Sesamum alatum]
MYEYNHAERRTGLSKKEIIEPIFPSGNGDSSSYEYSSSAFNRKESFLAHNQSLKAAQKHAISREKVSARLKSTLRRSHCIPEARSIGPDKPQFSASSAPRMPTPSTRSKKNRIPCNKLLIFSNPG